MGNAHQNLMYYPYFTRVWAIMAHRSQIGPPFPQILEHWHQKSWFVCFDVCQVPVKTFLTFLKKYLKNLALKNFGGPQVCDEKLEKIFLFNILKKMLILQTKFGFSRFLAFFWGIYFYSFSNFWSIKCIFWILWFQDSEQSKYTT